MYFSQFQKLRQPPNYVGSKNQGAIDCIPTTSENYVSFKIRGIVFFDSFQFMSSSQRLSLFNSNPHGASEIVRIKDIFEL